MALARALVIGAPDAGDESFWNALGIPKDMREGIVQSAGVTEIWSCNAKSFELFAALQTQWHVGMSGPIGLRYEAIYPLLDRKFKGKAWDQALADLQEMERAALQAMRENK